MEIPRSKGQGGQDPDPVLVLGAGYAGISVARWISHLTRQRTRVTIIDRLPEHVFRNELFKLDQMVRGRQGVNRWSIPVRTALGSMSPSTEFFEGTVESIDLDSRTVQAGPRSLSYSALAIALGSVPAYYHIPGAEQYTCKVYSLKDAMQAAQSIQQYVKELASGPSPRSPHIVVVGGGSTGTEVASEIADAHWSTGTPADAPRPSVDLVTGSVPFLMGLDETSIRRARTLLMKEGVRLVEDRNVRSVAPHELTLEDGTVLPFDVCIWCAGIEAPPVLRNLPIPHGHGGRLRVEATLELPGWPGVFGVGDVIELEDPVSGIPVPATAQAALAEAPYAARNIVARLKGHPLVPFHYRETSTLVSVGEKSAVGVVHRIPIWGTPAHLLKAAVEREYALTRGHGVWPWGL